MKMKHCFLVMATVLLALASVKTLTAQTVDLSKFPPRPDRGDVSVHSVDAGQNGKMIGNLVELGSSQQAFDPAAKANIQINTTGEKSNYPYFAGENSIKTFFPASTGEGIVLKDREVSQTLWLNPSIAVLDRNRTEVFNRVSDPAAVRQTGESISYSMLPGIDASFSGLKGGFKSNYIISSLQGIPVDGSGNDLCFVEEIELGADVSVYTLDGRLISGSTSVDGFILTKSAGEKGVVYNQAFAYGANLDQNQAQTVFQYMLEGGNGKTELDQLRNSVNNCKYDLRISGNTLKVYLRVSGDWLTDPTVQYPVTVDPVITIGTGTATSSSATITPYSTLWHDGRHQYLILASELTGAGGAAGNITSLAFNLSTVGSPAMAGFNVKVGHTALTALTTTYQVGLTTVYTSASYTPAGTGWQTLTFSTPFNWNGTSNLIIEVCFDNASYSSSSTVYYSTTAFNSNTYGYMDGGTGCTMTAPTYLGVNTSRPNMRLNMSGAPVCPTVGFYRASDKASLASISPVNCSAGFWITGYDSIDAGGYVKPGWSIVFNTTDAYSDTENSLEVFADGASIGGFAPSDPGWPWWGGPVGEDVIWTVYADGFDPAVSWSMEWCDSYPDGTFPYEVFDHCDLTTPVLSGTFNHPPACHNITLGTLDGIAVFSGPGITNTGDGWAWFDAAAAGPGTHTIQYCWDNEHGCSNCVTQQITVTGPSASAGTGSTICSGASTTVGGSPTGSGGTGAGTYTYAWSPATGLSSTTVANPTANPTATTTYTVTVTDDNGAGCTATSSVTVTVNPLPTAYNVTGGGAYCSGGSGLTVGLSGSQVGVNYQLQIGGVNSGAAVAGTGGALSWTNQSTAGTYTVVATNTTTGCTRTMTGSVTITINPLPALYTVTGGGTYCSGGAGVAVGLNGSVSGTSYQLYDDGSATGSAVNGTGSPISFGNQTSAGTYTVVATITATGCTRTMTGSVTVTVNPSPTATAGNGGPYCVGQTISLTSSGGTSYSWSGPNSFTSSSQNPTIAGATTAMGGVYTVTVTNASSCTATATTSVTVNTNPTANAGVDQTICAGATATLTASGGGTYQWTGGATTASINVTPASTTTYTVTVTNASGCTATDQVQVTVNAVPTPTAGNGGPYCVGQTISLTSSGGSTYSWSGPGGFTSALQNPTRAGATLAMGGVYTVTVTNAALCTATATTTVTVNANPTANAGVDQTICNGQTATLTATGGGSYSWTGGATTASINVSPGSTTTYTVTVTNASFCTSTDQVQVTVNAVPTATAGNGGPYCVGATISLTSSGGTSYSWSGPAAFTSTAQNPTRAGATLAMGGVYTVTVTNAASCTATATTSVTVNANPAANAGVDQTICNGQSATLTATGGSSYSWSTGGSTPTIVVSPGTTTTYTVTVTNASSCTATDAVQVTVNALPTPTAGNGGPYCVGQTIALTSSGGTSYSWSGPAAFTSTAQNPTRPGATLAMAGVYTVTVTNAASCTATATTSVTVNANPTANAGIDQTICAGATATLTATGGVSYSWTGGGTTASINVTPGSTTTYTVTVTNASSCTATDQVQVTVNANPVANAGVDQTIPNGTSTSLAGTAAGGSGSYTWTWSPAGSLINPNIQNPTTTNLSSTTTYTLTVTDAVTGCTSTDQMTVTVSGGPLAAAASATPNAICAGASSQLAANATGGSGTYSYSWSSSPAGFTSSTANPIVSPAATTTYTVTVNDGFNTVTSSVVVTVNANPVANAGVDQTICNGQTATLTATGGGTYAWTGGGTTASINVTPGSTSTYTVTVTNAALCTSTDAVVVTVNSLPTPSAGNGGPYCVGQNISLTSSGGSSYSWSGPAAFTSAVQDPTRPSATLAMAGVYTVTVTNAASCTATATTSVTVNANPTANAGTDQVICVGQTATLTATGGGTYEWNTGATTASLNATPLVTTTYTVTVTNASGCTSSDAVLVTVNSVPTPSAGNGGPYCVGQTIALTSSGGTSYSWSGPSGYTSTAQNPSLAGATLAMGGVYTVTVTNAASCTATATTTVTVNANPTANAGLDQTICNGVTATLTATGGGTYVWTGGGTTASINVTPGTTTTYTVTVTNAALCTSTDAVVVTVNPLPTIYNVTGGGAYCVGSPGPTVGLSGSQVGVNYQLVINTVNSGAPVAGTGSALSWTNQTTAGTYQVVATNASTGCTSNMNSSANVVQNAVPVVNAGTDQTIPNGTSTSLDASVSGGSGSYSYAWSPIGSLVSATVQDPTTVNLSATTTFTLVVTDQTTLCTGTDQVIVNITGSPLAVVVTGVPTTICLGESVQLNAAATGGSGTYTYTWASSPAGFSSSVSNPLVSPTASTTYYVTVNDGFNSVNGNVAITVNPLPSLYTVSGGGAYCSGGTGLNVILSGSQIGVNYQLQINGTNSGAPVAGTSAGLAWNNQTTAGTYTVVATNSATGCTNTMSSSAVIAIDPLPLVYNVTGGGDYCFGGAGVVVGLDNSQLGITYQLQVNGTNTGAPLAGSGSAISFGNQTAAGTYTIVATNASTSCTEDMAGSVVVVIDPLPTVYTMTGGGDYCNGGTGVSVGLSDSEAGISYQLQLDGSDLGAPLAGTGNALDFGLQTSAGTYTVIATNTTTSCVENMGGTAIVVIDPLPVAYNVTGGGGYCSGGTGVVVGIDGSDVGITYTLYLDGSATTQTVLGDGNPQTYGDQTVGGVYTVVATNNTTACVQTMTGNVTVTVWPLPQIDSMVVVPLTSCLAPNGEATIYASGGTTPYEYSVDNTNYYLTALFTGLPAGQVNGFIEDANGCSASYVETIPDNTGFAVDSVVTTDALCFGDSTGVIVIYAPGAVQYSIDNGTSFQASNTFTGLPVGDYDFVAVDGGGCTDGGIAKIFEPALITATYNTVGASCFGFTDGQAEVIPLGGTPGFTYLWDNAGASDSSIAAGLTANIYYHVTITDSHGCFVIDSVMVSEPVALTSAISGSASPLCFGSSDGEATVTPANGTPGYTYLWDDVAATTDSIATDLLAGQYYHVTVTDANGCFVVDSVMLNNPPVLSGSITATDDVSCFGLTDGSATITPVGGTPGYTYQWTLGGTDSTNTGMAAANLYHVTVTDANGCTYVDSVTLGQPTVLLASASSVNASCGLSDGSVSVIGTGGTLPYTYLWNTTDVTDTVYGLGAGIYTVTVYDVNGCNTSASATITTDAAATITVNSITNILCYGDSEGAVDLSLNGGTPDFTVVVASTDTSFYTTNAIVIDSLGAGTFLIEISDANGCSSDTTITINQPASPVLVNTSISSISCHGLTDGIIIANVSGGTSPYNYNWSNGTTGIGINTITGLPAQTYTLTVTDANGCTVIRVELGVTQPDSIEITFAAVSPVCGGIDNGSLTALVQGGVQPYDYAWTTGGGDSLITGLGGGQYIVTVTDAHMCNVTVSYTLFEPTVIVVDTTTGSDPSTNLGFIHLEVTGGGMPYLYAWSNGATSQDLDGLASGTYTLTLTDDNGCVLTLSFVIEIPLKIPDAITPNSDGINDQFEILNIGAYMDISIQIFNRWGDQVFLFEGTGTEYTDMENQWDGQYNGADLPMGGYVYIIKLGDKEPITGVVTIIR